MTKHFKKSELECKCCGSYVESVALLLVLEDVRRHFKRPVKVTSSTRCANHNKEVGGKPGSSHLFGEAADIQIDCVNPLDIYNYLNECAYSDLIGLSCYKTFVHVDVRGKRARW